MARAKNIYIADLNLEKIGESKTITFSDDNNDHNTSVTISRVSTTEYKFDSAESFDDELAELIDRRYVGKTWSTEDFDQRMRDLQYEMRNTMKSHNLPIDGETSIDPAEPKNDPDPAPEPTMSSSEPVYTSFEPVEDEEDEEPLTPNQPLGLDGMITQAVMNIVKSSGTKKQIEKTTRQLLDRMGIVPGVIEHKVSAYNQEPINVGKQHREFSTILSIISVRENPALVGPAGSGKTTAVKSVAKALSLKFYSKSVSSHTGVHEFFGYQDANGNYVRTLFREAYENGGVFLLDEFDAGNPNVLAAMNQAVGNDSCAFADGMIDKHADFVCVMAGNTFGNGATAEYVGRNKIDKATLDRFVFLSFDYDEDFEYQLTPNKDWCKLVQRYRKTASEKKVKCVISPRSSLIGSNLLNAGIDQDKVELMTVFKGLSQDEISLIKG